MSKSIARESGGKVYACASMSVHIHVRIDTGIYAFAPMCVYMCACIYMQTYVCVHIFIVNAVLVCPVNVSPRILNLFLSFHPPSNPHHSHLLRSITSYPLPNSNSGMTSIIKGGCRFFLLKITGHIEKYLC